MNGHAAVPVEVRERERVLDAAWRKRRFFCAEWDVGIRLLLEAFGRLVKVALMGSGGSPFFAHNEVRRYLFGLRWCVWWLQQPDRVVEQGGVATVDDAIEALDLGAKYDDIADMFKSCGARLATARITDDDAVIFEYDQAKRAAEYAALSAESDDGGDTSPSGLEAERSWLHDLHAFGRLLRSSDPSAVLASGDYKALIARAPYREVRRLPDDWDLGSYVIGDAVRALLALTWLGRLLEQEYGSATLEVGISERAALWGWFSASRNPRSAAKAWLNDMTCPPSARLNEVLLHPLFKVAGGALLASPAQLLFTRHERNLVKLPALLPERREVWERLKNAKEPLFREAVSVLLRRFGIESAGPVSYTFGGQRFDIDLVAWDRRGGCAFFELKWPIEADEIGEVKDDVLEFEVGATQLDRAASFALSDWSALRGLVRDIPDSCPAEGLGLCLLSRTTVPPRALTVGDVCPATFGALQHLAREGEETLSLRTLFARIHRRRDVQAPFIARAVGHGSLEVDDQIWLIPCVGAQARDHRRIR